MSRQRVGLVTEADYDRDVLRTYDSFECNLYEDSRTNLTLIQIRVDV